MSAPKFVALERLVVRVRIVDAVAAGHRLPLAVTTRGAGWKVLRRTNVDLVAAVGALVSAGRNVTAGGNRVSHGVLLGSRGVVVLPFRPAHKHAAGMTHAGLAEEREERQGDCDIARCRQSTVRASIRLAAGPAAALVIAATTCAETPGDPSPSPGGRGSVQPPSPR